MAHRTRRKIMFQHAAPHCVRASLLAACATGRERSGACSAGGWTLWVTADGYEIRHVLVDGPSAQRSPATWCVARAPTPPPAGERTFTRRTPAGAAAAKQATLTTRIELEPPSDRPLQATTAAGRWQRPRVCRLMARQTRSRHPAAAGQSAIPAASWPFSAVVGVVEPAGRPPIHGGRAGGSPCVGDHPPRGLRRGSKGARHTLEPARHRLHTHACRPHADLACVPRALAHAGRFHRGHRRRRRRPRHRRVATAASLP